MKTRTGTTFGLAAAAAAIAISIPVAVTAHGDPAPSPEPSPTTTSTTTTSTSPPPNPEGSGCDAYKKEVPSGKGSFNDMASESVTDAIASNPMLKTFNAGITGQLNPKVNLVDTLNTGYHVVFAPVDDAFAQLPPEQLDALKTDATALTNLLDYHIALGLLYPKEVHGRITTLQGNQVTVKGSGGDITVDTTAKVVCGGISTKNAVIYMIDTVLDPARSADATSNPTASVSAPATAGQSGSAEAPSATTTTTSAG